MFDPQEIKRDFMPFFAQKREGAPLIYLDSAATSARPKEVIDTISHFYSYENANVSRGLYLLSEQATMKFEEVRSKVKNFIAANNEKEIIFTKNTTESANLVMRGYCEKFIKKGDKIVTSVMEHHSNFVPWQEISQRKKAKFEIVDITTDGELDLDDFVSKIKKAKFLAISAASNVLGTINDIHKITKIAKEEGDENIVVFIDAAQYVPSIPIDVKKVDCDFLAFSAHKMLGPFGVGILYGKENILEKTDPFLYGSQMIRDVTPKKTTFNELPYKFESGTMDAASVIGFGTAIDYIEKKIGMENILAHEQDLVAYAMKRIDELNAVELKYHKNPSEIKILGPKDPKKRVGVLSFEVGGIHPHDVAALLDEGGICIRSGHHCAMPLHQRLKISASNRASFYVYNDKNDVEKLMGALIAVKKIFNPF